MPSGLVGQALGRAVDAEQLGVLAGAADHVVLVAEGDAEVAVGDAAVELAGLAAHRRERDLEAREKVVKLAHHHQATVLAP
jgi:hypothetical protein